MACFHPLRAWRRKDGSIVFEESCRYDTLGELTLPCGRCRGCRLERSRQWALRCVHEAKLHKRNSFITLTYDDLHLPVGGSLHYPHFQSFLRRLRKSFAPGLVRFYMCGEYGPLLSRPHYHSCLFGVDFDDRVYSHETESGARLYTSSDLERLWPFGFSTVGDVTFESAAYCARYCMQKVTGDPAKSHYSGKVPEFNHMSLRPGVARDFFLKYRADIYPGDHCVINGKETKPPRYYDKQLSRVDPATFRDVQALRELDAWDRRADNTPERLAAKEEVAAARVSFLKRGLDAL